MKTSEELFDSINEWATETECGGRTLALVAELQRLVWADAVEALRKVADDPKASNFASLSAEWAYDHLESIGPKTKET